MPAKFCHVCESNGEKDEVCATHNSNEWGTCRYHGRNTKPKTPKRRPAADVASDLRDSVPLQSLDSSIASLAATSIDPSTLSGKTPKELLESLYRGEVSKAKLVEELASRLAEEKISDTAEKQLERVLRVVNQYDAVSHHSSGGTNATEAAKQVTLLQSKHGKLTGAYMACHRRIQHELHINKRSSNKQIYEHAKTGERVVESTPHANVESVDVLHMALIDFGYLAVAHDYLSPTESRALHHWVTRELYIDIAPFVAIHRTVDRLLRELDADHSKSLVDVIDSRAHRFLEEEVALHVTKPAGGAGKRVQGNKPDYGSMRPGDTGLACPWPARGLCWAHTNGKPCTSKTNGVCDFLQFHGKKCGKPLASGGTCNKAHRAVDCTEQ